MVNFLDSNTMTKVKKGLAKSFEATQVLSRTVNTSMITGDHDASTGETVYLKRFAEAIAHETADGDITGLTDSIVAGRAEAVVQPYITSFADWTNKEEMLELDELTAYLKPYTTRLVTQLELNLGKFMINNGGLVVGEPGTAVSKWSDIAAANTLADAMGIPVLDDMYYAMTPYTRENLADVQTGLADSGDLVSSAWKKAQIPRDFGGIKAISSNALRSYQNGAVVGAATLGATPAGGYVAHKDSMIQSWTVSGLTISTVGALRAGQTIVVTEAGRTRINPHTKEPLIDGTGTAVPYSVTVTEDADSDGSGDAVVNVTAAAINETPATYNNILTPLASGDTLDILGVADVTYQPNLFYHKNAFAVSSITPPRLKGGVETSYMSKGGLTIRISHYASGDANTQKVRFDIVPVFSALNQQWAGKGYGRP